MGRSNDEAYLPLATGKVFGRADWEKAAATVLKRAGKLAGDAPDSEAFAALSAATTEGLPIPALGTPSLTDGRPNPGAPGQAPFLRGSDVGTQPWDIRSYLADPEAGSAAAAALDDLEGGANSLWLRVGDGGTSLAQLPDVLGHVYLDLAPVVLQPVGDVPGNEVVEAFRSALDQRGLKPHPHSNLGVDPIGDSVRAGVGDATGSGADVTADVTATATATAAAAASALGIRGLVVDATVAHERGAGDAAELGYSLAVGVAYLRSLQAAGIEPDHALRLFEFRYAATDEQFTTIAKFRAARLLWDRVAELSGAAADRPGQAQHAVTSRLMMTRYDSWTNLLRTTVAAFSAGIGGAQAITDLPFDSLLGIPDAMGRRLARNISHLLISESHVAAAADAAGGAYAVEALTDEIAEAGWIEFQRIERSGSILPALADGSLAGRWERSRAARTEAVASRRSPITGVSEFPDVHELLPTRRDSPAGHPESTLAGEFEAMRDSPVPGPVFLATLGTVATHGARVAFARNAFAAGGINTVAAGATGSAQDVVEAFIAADSPSVVCLAGSDRSYADLGPQVITALREAGARWVILAGKPSPDLADAVDDHVAVGSDLVSFLGRTRQSIESAVSVAGSEQA